jgi:hypothetical protein
MSRNLYIPELGDHIQLAEDWTFELHREHRNTSLWDVLEVVTTDHYRWAFDSEETMNADAGYQACVAHPDTNVTVEETNYYHGQRLTVSATLNVTFPAGTILRMERIYIRKGSKEYDSVTFVVESTSLYDSTKRPRFWAKLADANRIVMEDEIPEVEVPEKKTKVAYRVYVVSKPMTHHSDYIDETYRQIHPRNRTSKFDDDEKFLERVLKEFGKERIARIQKSPTGTNSWATKWEILLDNDELVEEVQQEQTAYNRAEREFFEAEQKKIHDKYGDRLQMRGALGYYHQTLESFERDFIKGRSGMGTYL